MSVIQRIRDKGAWLIFGIISLALIAFILQDRSVGRGSSFSNTTTLGKVNGEKIERADFEKKMAFIERMNGQQAPARDQLITGLWNQEVNKIVMQQEYDKLGLVCTGNEQRDILFGENSPLKREFTDPKTGEFKANEAMQAFAQMKKSKNAEQVQNIYDIYVEPVIEKSLQEKYQALLQQAVYVPKWMVEKQQADNNMVSSVSFVYVPYNSVTDSSVKVSNDEIEAYGKKHRKEYEKDEEVRTISFVSFDGAANAADSLAVRAQVEAARKEFSETSDISAYLTRTGSDMPYYDGFISSKSIMQAKKDSIFKVGVGNVYGPYADGKDIVMAKLIATRQMPDTVTVRHILIGTVDPQSGQRMRADSTAKNLADSIQNAIKKGSSFDSLVVKFSDDGSKTKGGVYDNVSSGQMVPTFNDFIFGGKPGDKGIVKTDFGYHYIEILSQKGSSTAYKIAYLAKPVLASTETISAASTAAIQFAATSKNKKLFDENALKLNKPTSVSGEIKENDFSISGLGKSRQLIRWIYEHETGDVSEPTEIGEKYVVAVITSVNKPGLPSVASLRPLVENFVRNEKKASQIIETKFKGNTLEAYAASAGVQVQKSDSLLFGNSFVPGVGQEGKFIGAAFNKNLQGKASEQIAGVSGVYALRVEKIATVNNSTDPAVVKQGILQNQRVAVYRGMEALRKAATVKDYRSKFY